MASCIKSLAARVVARPPQPISSRDFYADRRPDFFLNTQSRDTSRDVLIKAYGDSCAKIHNKKQSKCENSDGDGVPFRRDAGIAKRAFFVGRDDARNARDVLCNMHNDITSSVHNKKSSDCQAPSCGDASRNGEALHRSGVAAPRGAFALRRRGAGAIGGETGGDEAQHDGRSGMRLFYCSAHFLSLSLPGGSSAAATVAMAAATAAVDKKGVEPDEIRRRALRCTRRGVACEYSYEEGARGPHRRP